MTPYDTAAMLRAKYESKPTPDSFRDAMLATVAESVMLTPEQLAGRPPGPVSRAKRDGAHKRLFWRVRHRVGPAWWNEDHAKLLRQMSWRRVI